LVPHHHPPPQGENPMDALRRIRAEIEHMERELIQLRRAALPTGELRLRIREYVTELGRAGMPSLFVDGEQCRIEPPGGMAAARRHLHHRPRYFPMSSSPHWTPRRPGRRHRPVLFNSDLLPIWRLWVHRS
jgi:hypothetical protein